MATVSVVQSRDGVEELSVAAIHARPRRLASGSHPEVTALAATDQLGDSEDPQDTDVDRGQACKRKYQYEHAGESLNDVHAYHLIKNCTVNSIGLRYI
jgi:hypothetical protein